MGAAAKLGLHADNQIEQLLTLNHLSDRLPAHCSRNHSFHISNVDPIPRDLVTIHVDQQARLPKFAHHREISEPGYFRQSVLDLNRFVLQHVQIVAIYFDRQRAFEAGQCFVYGIFGRFEYS